MKLQLGFPGERYIYLPLHITQAASQHPLTRGLYIKFMGHFVNAKFHYINRPDGIDDYIMIYCKDGLGWVKIDKKRYTLKKDTFIILPPHIPHSYGADDVTPWSIYWFHFRGDNAEYVSSNYYVPTQITPENNSRIMDRITIFEEIYYILSLGQSIEHVCYASMCFTHFFSTLLYIDIYRQVKNSKENQETDECSQRINRLTHYMNECIDQKLTIKDFASFMNLSASHLHRVFVKRLNISPMNYFIRLKINLACNMLNHSNLRINQISAKVGYSDAAYFSRIFTHIMGISPQNFRKHQTTNIKQPLL